MINTNVLTHFAKIKFKMARGNRFTDKIGAFTDTKQANHLIDIYMCVERTHLC